MPSRLSELAGCMATAEAFFPARISDTSPSSNSQLDVILIGSERHESDSALGLQLTSLLQEVESATSRAKRLIASRSQEALATRTRPQSWSVAECLEHLALTTRAFLPPIAEIMARTPPLTKIRSLRADMLAKVLIRVLEPPYRLRHKVIAHLAPKQGDFPSAWKVFLESQQELAQIVRSAAGLAIDMAKIQSPVCSHLSYSVYGAMGILSAHQRRHLWQAEQVLRALDRRTV